MSKKPGKLSVSTIIVEAKRLAILGSLLDTYSETNDRLLWLVSRVITALTFSAVGAIIKPPERWCGISASRGLIEAVKPRPLMRNGHEDYSYRHTVWQSRYKTASI